MSGPGPTLWWLYDPEQGSFSTLPPGPFLVPALIVFGLAALVTGKPFRRACFHDRAGELQNTSTWKKRHERYLTLQDRYINDIDGMPFHELVEYKQLTSYMYNPVNNPYDDILLK